MAMPSSTPVLIVGAGPTGLNLALSLARRHIPCRIISEDSGPGQHSRAMVVQARTLEFYDQLGFADEVVQQGIPVEHVRFRESTEGSHQEVTSVTLRELGEGLSPFPFLLAYPQDDHERFLLQKLSESGVEVAWNEQLTGFSQSPHAIHAQIRHADGWSETVEAAYLAGCDGAHSRVRQTLNINFAGGTYDQSFYVADVRVQEGFQRDFEANLGHHSLAMMLPVRSTGAQRLIGLVPPEFSERKHLTFENLRAHVEPLLGVHVTEVQWFSTYRVHHRVAGTFRVGRAFLLGDAGHVHSPVGGQGMNTGIGDAVNLGWKLAQVVRGEADAKILDSYETERLAFAKSLVATTDRAFTPMVAPGLKGELVRRWFAPLLLSVATRLTLTRHSLFRTVSQIHIHYPDSLLSEGKAGKVQGGDRLPWSGFGNSENNFQPLRSLSWQVHIYGDPKASFQQACIAPGLPLHEFPFNAQAQDAGFQQNAAYLIRPDGYVALAMPEQGDETLTRYLEHHQLHFGSSALAMRN